MGKPGQREIEGTDGPDVIVAQRGTRFVEGKGGRDTICAGPGDNAIAGGAGGDRVIAGPGNDQIDADATDIVRGGAGRDEAHYLPLKRLEAGVEVDLAKGVVSSVVDLGGDDPHGRIDEVEIVTGTDFADELRGDSRPNRLFGQDGRDFLDGGGGGDKLNGGDDPDEVSYESARAAVRTTDGELPHQRLAQVGGRTDSIAFVEIVTGSDFDDRLGGVDDPEFLYGGKGDDIVKGLGGSDRLFGGPGDDIIAPGAGDDRVEGGDNRDVTGKDEHGDLVSFQDAELEGGYDQMEVHLDLGLPPPVSPFQPRLRYHATGEGNDIITGVESVRGMDRAFNFIYGNDKPNVIIGGKKGDYVEAFDGDDWVFTRSYPDTIYGGDGDDYLDPGGSHEITNGGEGNDTCVGVDRDYRESCERER